MIINPFHVNEEKIISQVSTTSKIQEVDVDVNKIQKYIISNYMVYVQKMLKEELTQKIHEHLYKVYNIKNDEKLNYISDMILNKMFGYDILQKYIEDDEVTDIRVVKYDSVYVKKMGKWYKADDSFSSDDEFNEYIRYSILKNNSNINFDKPLVTVSDKHYNLRIEAGILPVNAISSNLVIRIHRHSKSITLESLLLVDEMLDANSYQIIYNAINQNKNIVLSGKGGSGKTSLLRAMIAKIPDEYAITTNEETTELYIENKNVIQREVLENRESNKIDLRKLMKQSLVMSNDVIIVGELKGEETTFFLDSIQTGHMGLATVHSDSADNTINRLIVLLKRDIKNQQYKEEFIQELLCSSIDYIIYLEGYKVKQIMSIHYDKKTHKIVYCDEYKLEEG